MDVTAKLLGKNDPTPIARPISLSIIADAWKWRKGTIFAWLALCLLLAGIGLYFSRSYYVATAELLLETGRGAPDRADTANNIVDMSVIESQVEVLNSTEIAKTVMERLDLWNDPEFTAPQWNPLSLVTQFFPDTASRTNGRSPEELKRETALAGFQQALTIDRTGRSYAAQISFKSRDPRKAAKVANAVAHAYVDDQIGTRAGNALKASEWMEKRIGELRNRSINASQAVEELKQRDNIIVDESGKLSNERELDELSSSLARARADTEQARARVARAEDVVRKLSDGSDRTGLTVISDELSNPVIVKLRQRYEDADRQQADLSKRFGEQHQAPVLLRNEMAGIRNSIKSEVERISAAARSDFEIAAGREHSIEQRITQVFQDSGRSREALTKLRQLQAESQTYKTIHDAFLNRYTEALQQQSSPLSEARIISEAWPPLSKSSPKVPLAFLLAACAGGLIGLGFGVRREYVERLLRTPEQLEKEIGVHSLGMIPNVPGRRLFPSRKSAPPLLLRDDMDTLRRVKIAIDHASARGNVQAVGVLSAQSGEGKSTVAFNLAVLAGETGARVLLIDANLRRPTLARGLMRKQPGNFLAPLEGKSSLSECVLRHDLGFDFIGERSGDCGLHPCLLLASHGMRSLIDAARAHYDFIVCDFPSALEHADVYAAAELFDAFVLVTEWGRTSTMNVAETLLRSKIIDSQLVGALINKAPRRAAA